MSKKIKIDFYKVVMHETAGVTFEAILQQVDALSTKDRVKEVRFHQIWLSEFCTQPQFCEGDMIRLRMSNVPIKGNLAGNVEEISLAHDEGIGEQTAFLYHIPTKVLALQSNQSGTSASVFAQYFEEMSGINQPIHLDPVLQIDAMERLLNMTSVSNFEVRVAGLENMNSLQNQDLGLKNFISLSETFRAPTVSVKVSVGRKKKKSLDVEEIKHIARNLARMPQPCVKKIRISGSTEEEENIYLDLLKDRMRESVDMNQGTNRSVSYLLRQKAMREGWMRRESDLTKMFIQ